MKRLFLIPCLLVTLSLLTQGQSLELRAKIKTFKNNRRFTVDYDRFKDRTTIWVGPFLVRGLALDMSAGFSFPGEQLKERPKDIVLMFGSSSSEWQFLNDQSLYAIVDGERMELGDGERSSKVNSSRFGLYSRSAALSEKLWYRLSYETFEKLATAKSLDIRVGPQEFSFKDEHFTAWRDFLRLAEP